MMRMPENPSRLSSPRVARNDRALSLRLPAPPAGLVLRGEGGRIAVGFSGALARLAAGGVGEAPSGIPTRMALAYGARLLAALRRARVGFAGHNEAGLDFARLDFNGREGESR